MANTKAHIGGGAVCGMVTYAAMCKQLDRPADLGELLLCLSAGIVGGLAPDILEPAISPHHRSVAHSITGGLSLWAYVQSRCGQENQGWNEFAKILFASFAAGYFSHLALDLYTPSGLPLLA
jgi:inner membrane protein